MWLSVAWRVTYITEQLQHSWYVQTYNDVSQVLFADYGAQSVQGTSEK